MTIIQLDTFLSIEKTGSFSGAAAELGYAQSTVTMQMKQLENQLKITQQRKEAAQKMLDKNIQDAFSYGHGR